LCTAQVKEKAQILSIPRNVVLEVGKQFPVLYRNLFKNSIRNERQLYALMGGMLFYPLRVRLAGRLLILLEEHGEVTSDGVMLETRLSQNDFAQLAMGSRQRVNKIFREWVERGILSMVGENYLVTDMERLRAELDQDGD
jgi:CRP/FNR family cyclic AMP-dependent transcriptional regulator